MPRDGCQSSLVSRVGSIQANLLLCPTLSLPDDLIPHLVTNMRPVPESITAPNTDKFVKSALSHLGVSSRTTGYWGHYYIMWLSNIVPEGILANIIHNMMMGVKAKNLARMEKAK